MISVDAIRSEIPDFAGYETQDARRKSDEQVRAHLGERLAMLAFVDALSEAEREMYDRVLLECEFMNQTAFHSFELKPPDDCIESVFNADAQLVQLAKRVMDAQSAGIGELLAEIQEVFTLRNNAMQNA